MQEKFFLQPGCIIVSKKPHLVSTILGSCVSVCIWDSKQHFGGMNHYIHPKSFDNEETAKFGNISIPYMLNLLLESDAKMHDLKAHIVGGARSPHIDSSIIGQENVKIAETFLRQNSIDIISKDTGGNKGRKVIFDTQSGEVIINKVNNIKENNW